MLTACEPRQASVTVRRAVATAALLLLASAPALVDSDSVAEAASLHELANLPNPYCPPAAAWQVILRAVLASASATVLFLTPGLLLALALRLADQPGRWILHGVVLSVAVNSLGAIAWSGLVGEVATGPCFARLVLGCSLTAFGVLLVSTLVTRLPWPIRERGDLGLSITCLIAPWLLAIAVAPKVFWENFNGDGAHAFEASRNLLSQPLPFFDRSAGMMASYPGVSSCLYLYTNSWYLRLFGPVEASVRLPFFPALSALFAALWGAIRVGQSGRPARFLPLILWLQLGGFALVQVYSTTYDPYLADMALPGVEDTLAIAFFIGVIASSWEGRRVSLVLCGLALFLCSPGCGLYLGAWLAGVYLCRGDRRWATAGLVAGLLAALVLLGALLPRLLSMSGLPTPGSEHNLLSSLTRFRYLQITHVERLAWAAVPCGIAPALALLDWKRNDELNRALTVTTVLIFGFFYIMAYTSLHYYAPAMVLPLVVLWRQPVFYSPRHGRLARAAVAALCVAGIGLSLPRHAGIVTAERVIGEAIDNRIPGYEQSQPRSLFAADLLQQVIPPDSRPSVPEHSFGGSAVAWNYYAHRKRPSHAEANYLLQPVEAPAPTSYFRRHVSGGVALYVLDEGRLNQHLGLRPAASAGARLYTMDRDLLFHGRNAARHPEILDLAPLLLWSFSHE